MSNVPPRTKRVDYGALAEARRSKEAKEKALASCLGLLLGALLAGLLVMWGWNDVVVSPDAMRAPLGRIGYGEALLFWFFASVLGRAFHGKSFTG